MRDKNNSEKLSVKSIIIHTRPLSPPGPKQHVVHVLYILLIISAVRHRACIALLLGIKSVNSGVFHRQRLLEETRARPV